MIRILLALTLIMLLPSDFAAAQNSGLRPNAQTSLNSIGRIRAATVVTATYASYPANATSTILSASFPAGSFVEGNQLRFFLWGTIDNTSGTPKSFSPSLYVTQGVSTQSAAFLYTAPNGSSEWIIDGSVAFSVIGNPPISPAPRDKVGGTAPNASLAVGSMIRLANRTGVGTVAQDFAVVTDPNSLTISSTMPVGIEVRVNTTANITFTVHGGWLEAL